MTTIRLRRNTIANIPKLQLAEAFWATDTKELYVGDGTTNYKAAAATITSVIDTDITLAANSDVLVASQKATKAYAIAHALATAANDFLVASGIGVFVKKTLAEVKTILGLGTAAYLDVGIGANQVVQMTVATKLPAVDGSLLTGIATGVPRSYLAGLGVTTAADADHDRTIAVGTCRDSANAYDLTLAAVMTKQIDAAWAAGTNAGGLFSGGVGVSTWYHVFLIRKDADGTIDAGFDTSITAANIPVGYTAYRRIRSVLTDGAANIIPDYQLGDDVLWMVPILDLSEVIANTNQTIRTLSVPLGVIVKAHMNVSFQFTSNNFEGVYFAQPGIANQAPAYNASPGNTLGGSSDTAAALSGQVDCLTNLSSQITTRNDATGRGLYIITLGYTDKRGRDD